MQQNKKDIMKSGDENMKLRQFEQRDERKVIELWNRCCTEDQISLGKFRMQAIYDDNYDETLSWTVFDGEGLIGFIMATKRKFPYMERGLEPERGWINVLFVDPKVRRQKVGTLLLETAEKELLQRGVKSITLGAYSPNYFFPGVDENHYPEAASFFQKHNYQRKDMHYSMGMDLNGIHIPEGIIMKKQQLEKEGYQFIEFDGDYSLELLNFIKHEFGGGWKRSALTAMKNHTAEEVILLVLNPKGMIIGFCMRAIDENPERFGPIGIAKEYRNTGIGSVLLHLQCQKMKEKGCKRMYFMTTDEAGKRYYQRNGLSVLRTFVGYQKEL